MNSLGLDLPWRVAVPDPYPGLPRPRIFGFYAIPWVGIPFTQEQAAWQTKCSPEAPRMCSASADPILTFREGECGSGAVDERRRRPRVRLQLPVSLHPGKNEAPFACTTRDISSDGFLCLTPRAFEAGETLTCVISCPSNAHGSTDRPFLIRSRIRVVRCEEDPDSGLYRTACRIEDYDCNHLSMAASAQA